MFRTKTTDAIFASDTCNNISVFDLRRGTTLMQYKSGMIGTHCLNVLNNDYVLAAEKGPLIYVWPINSQEKLQNVRMLCPGVIGCCIASPNGLYVAVSIGEKLLIWQLSSGKLLCTCSSHYQTITIVKWSFDSSDIATGGEDGLVCVWKLSHLISSNYMYLGIQSGDATTPQTAPHYTFSHHSVKITDLYIGYGGLRSRLFTISADKTCKIYDLSTGNQLLSVIFDIRPTCIITDVLEVNVFVGSFDGHIKMFSLRDPPRNLEHHFKETDFNLQFMGHTKAITCLSFSVDEVILISGSVDETIRLWHITSKQCIKTIRMKGSISNIVARTVPESLQSYELYPITIVKSFQKRYDDNQDAQTLDVVCSVDNYNEDGQEAKIVDSVSVLAQKIEKLKRINRELFCFAKNKLLEKSNSGDLIGRQNEKQISVIVPEKNVNKNKRKKMLKRKSKE